MSQSRALTCPLKVVLLAITGSSFFGCASTQLNYNTLNLARSLDELSSHQIYFNLEQIAVDEYATPSQASIAAGTATTMNTISPTLMLPLGAATTATSSLASAGTTSLANAVTNGTTNTVANTLTATTTGTQTNVVSSSASGAVTSSMNTVSTATANAASNAVTGATNGSTTSTGTNANTTTDTGTSAVTHSNKSLSLAFTDNWSQSWTLNPAADADELRRLRALYRYALGKTDADIGEFKPGDQLNSGQKHEVDEHFKCEYALQLAKATPPQARMHVQAVETAQRATELESKAEGLNDDAERATAALLDAQEGLSEFQGSTEGSGRTARARDEITQMTAKVGELAKARQSKQKEANDARSEAEEARATAAASADADNAAAGSVQVPVTCQFGDQSITVKRSVDSSFVQFPSCVICQMPDKSFKVNPELAFGFIAYRQKPHRWGFSRLRWTSDLEVCGGPYNDDRKLSEDKVPHDARDTLCTDNGRREFHELVLFIYEATTQSSSPTATKGAPATKALVTQGEIVPF